MPLHVLVDKLWAWNRAMCLHQQEIKIASYRLILCASDSNCDDN